MLSLQQLYCNDCWAYYCIGSVVLISFVIIGIICYIKINVMNKQFNVMLFSIFYSFIFIYYFYFLLSNCPLIRDICTINSFLYWNITAKVVKPICKEKQAQLNKNTMPSATGFMGIDPNLYKYTQREHILT